MKEITDSPPRPDTHRNSSDRPTCRARPFLRVFPNISRRKNDNMWSCTAKHTRPCDVCEGQRGADKKGFTPRRFSHNIRPEVPHTMTASQLFSNRSEEEATFCFCVNFSKGQRTATIFRQRGAQPCQNAQGSTGPLRTPPPPPPNRYPKN